MIRTYTDKWNGFQFREPVYLDGRRVPTEFDLVKWAVYDKPIEVVDTYTKEKIFSHEYCFSIGKLNWDKKDKTWEFESCGLRYLEYRIDGLEQFILDFCKMMEEELLDEER